jgi:uncharacterized protein DUF5916/cellulose/xylan binding protein with CBM9 domain
LRAFFSEPDGLPKRLTDKPLRALTLADTAAAVFLAILLGVQVSAQSAVPPDLRARRALTAPKIDGLLDDDVWTGEALPLERWVSYNPLRGEAAPGHQRTSVWIAYDERAVYFAFRCNDAEPAKIRTTITRRDNAWNDDWVAVSLDSSRAGQVAYHMFVNPSGIQMDGLNTGSNGEDMSPDWVWQSAGHIDEQGYTVEIRLPLESIRFRGGMDVRMGIMFFRHNSRLGVSWSWPEMPPGKWVFETHVPLVFAELHQPRVLEVIPSGTLSSNEIRPIGRPWPGATNKGDAGVSAKYGLTSSIALDATVNPDFSQVESDAFQIEVNQRFPIFFSEKRPFFMEGLGLFNLAGTGGDASMRTAVHTRRIIDPSAGVKVTGASGRESFALLSTSDASTGDQTMFTIGRAVHNFGQGQYVGALVTDSEFQSQHNRVAGGDFVGRRGEHVTFNGSLLYADSRQADGESRQGVAAQGSYSYNSRRLNVSGQVEHYDRDFQMETAFINRVGLSRWWGWHQVQFYPDPTRYGWIKRVAPFTWMAVAKDRVQGGTELFALPGLQFNFTRQGNLRIQFGRGHETFVGQRFTTGTVRVGGGAQITKWLNFYGSIDGGPGIFYDPANPFQGAGASRYLEIGLQPNARLDLRASYNFAKFDRETGEKVFGVHILNLRDTYQFTSRFLVRATVQYDSSRRRILEDFLASYELAPGTVVHFGYGSVAESLSLQPGGQLGPYSPYQATARALFSKVSYLFRI